MQFRGVMGLFLTVLSIQISSIPCAQSSEINGSLEASVLKSGYAIRLLKPLPRRNSGCSTFFRNGQVLESCEPNYGMDPAIDGVVRSYCEWNLNAHYQKDNSSKWLEAYFSPNLIQIVGAKVGSLQENNGPTLLQKWKSTEKLVERWIELDLNDGETGSKLGSLKCYPSRVSEVAGSKALFGEENGKATQSGLSIQNILDELAGYVEIVKMH